MTALLLTGCQKNQTTESEPEQETGTQTSAETQVSETEATSSLQTSASTLNPVTEVSNTTQVSSTETGVSASEVSSTTQATTKAQSSSSDNNSNNSNNNSNSNSNSNTQKSEENKSSSPEDNYTFRLDSIGQPGNMSSFIVADRTSDGFGCITYNFNDSRMYYHHFSEDMQTSNTTSFAIPELDGYHFTPNYHYYYIYAFEGSDIWSILTLWKDDELKTSDSDSGEESTVPNRQILLCHNDKSGSLLSAIPVDYLMQEENYGLIESFNCADGVLYMMMNTGKILQIDKETANVTLAADVGSENYYEGYNYKYLCFDRDNKPVLFQKKVWLVPDYSRVDEAAVLEFDLASGSSGQTLFTIDEELDEISFLKGSGEYRFFINTYKKFIGVKDNGEQEVLIDIEADNLEKRIMKPDGYAKPYTNDMFDINIVPVDKSKYLALYEHYPENRTEAYRLTRK